MPKIALACTALLFFATPAMAGSKLSGHWQLAKGNCAQRAFTFGDSAEVVDEAYPGFAPSRSTYQVSYNDANPRITYVMAHDGETHFTFIAPNRVLMDTSDFCEYVRQ